MEAIRAVIPAAGIGKRMRPLTHTRPKVLLPLAGRAMIGHLIADLIKVGITEITVVIGFYGEKVREYCLKTFPEVSFRFVEQKDRLGLGHAIGQAVDPGDERILVVLGDTLFKGDLGLFRGDDAALGLVEVDDPSRFGVAVVEDGRITHLEEKPENPRSNLAIAGVYYFPDAGALKRAIDTLVEQDIRTRDEYQITDAMHRMIHEGHTFRPVLIEGWYDCGMPSSLVETNRVLFELHPELANVTEEIRRENLIVDPVFIDPTADIRHSVIGPYVHIGARCRVRRSVLSDTIVDSGTILEGQNLKGAVLGSDVLINTDGRALMLGDNSRITG